jgi:hypothetical protein
VTRRSLLVAAGWFGAAVLAVLVGLAAISVIGAGLMSSDATPRTQAEVAREAAALPSSAPSARTSLGTPSSPAESSDRSFITAGGTVVARCVGGQAEIRSMSPYEGYAVHERDQGPQAEAEGEFRSTSDNHDRAKFSVRCTGGKPALSDRSSD